MNNPKMIGDIVCDMHGKNLRIYSELRNHFEVRSVIEFPLSDADRPLREREPHQPQQSQCLEGWLSKLARDAGHRYMNKYLIVVGESTPDGWMPCAYLYDGRRVGFCEIRSHGDRLAHALEGR